MDSGTLLQYQYHLLAEYQPFGCKQANRYFTYKWLLCWISRNEDNIRETLPPLLCCWGQDRQIGEIGNQTNRQIVNQGNQFVNWAIQLCINLLDQYVFKYLVRFERDAGDLQGAKRKCCQWRDVICSTSGWFSPSEYSCSNCQMSKTKLKKRKGDGVGKLMAITRGRREDPRDVLARTSHQLHTETDTVKQYAC